VPDVSPIQLVIVLVIALVILGPKRLPDVGKSLGRGIREFKDSVSGNEPPAPPMATHDVAALDTPAPDARGDEHGVTTVVKAT
jgi:sec-independent protein translocase protein TatA